MRLIVALAVVAVAHASVDRITQALELLAHSTDKAEVFLNLQDDIVGANLHSAFGSLPVTDSVEADLKLVDEHRDEYLKAFSTAIDRTLELVLPRREILDDWLLIRLAHQKEAVAFRAFTLAEPSIPERQDYFVEFIQEWAHIEEMEKNLFGKLVGILQVELRLMSPKVPDTSSSDQFNAELAKLAVATRDLAAKSDAALHAPADKAFRLDGRIVDVRAARENIAASTAYHISLRRMNAAFVKVEPMFLPWINTAIRSGSSDSGMDDLQKLLHYLSNIQANGLDESTFSDVLALCETLSRMVDRISGRLTGPQADALASLADLDVIAAAAIRASAQEDKVLAGEAEPASLMMVWTEVQLLTHRIRACRAESAAVLENAQGAVVVARREFDTAEYSVAGLVEVKRNLRLLMAVVCDVVLEEMMLSSVNQAAIAKLDVIKRTLLL